MNSGLRLASHEGTRAVWSATFMPRVRSHGACFWLFLYLATFLAKAACFNHHGVAQRQHLEKLFYAIDIDGDGEIEHDEASKYLKRAVSGESSDGRTTTEESSPINDEGRDVAGSRESMRNIGSVFRGVSADFKFNYGGSAISHDEFKSYLRDMLTVNRVVEWVTHGLGLPQYEQTFRKNAIDGLTFPSLLENLSVMQEELGITSMLHASKIRNGIYLLMLGIGEAPGLPAGLECQGGKYGGIVLRWSRPESVGTPPVHKYVVERQNVDDLVWILTGEVDDPGGKTSEVDFFDYNMQAGAVYNYRLRAWGAYGPSEYACIKRCHPKEIPRMLPGPRASQAAFDSQSARQEHLPKEPRPKSPQMVEEETGNTVAMGVVPQLHTVEGGGDGEPTGCARFFGMLLKLGSKLINGLKQLGWFMLRVFLADLLRWLGVMWFVLNIPQVVMVFMPRAVQHILGSIGTTALGLWPFVSSRGPGVQFQESNHVPGRPDFQADADDGSVARPVEAVTESANQHSVLRHSQSWTGSVRLGNEIRERDDLGIKKSISTDWMLCEDSDDERRLSDATVLVPKQVLAQKDRFAGKHTALSRAAKHHDDSFPKTLKKSCNAEGCTVQFNWWLYGKPRHYCNSCQGVFCVNHTEYADHNGRFTVCRLESRCICKSCFARRSSSDQARLMEKNKLLRGSQRVQCGRSKKERLDAHGGEVPGPDLMMLRNFSLPISNRRFNSRHSDNPSTVGYRRSVTDNRGRMLNSSLEYNCTAQQPGTRFYLEDQLSCPLKSSINPNPLSSIPAKPADEIIFNEGPEGLGVGRSGCISVAGPSADAKAWNEGEREKGSDLPGCRGGAIHTTRTNHAYAEKRKNTNGPFSVTRDGGSGFRGPPSEGVSLRAGGGGVTETAINGPRTVLESLTGSLNNSRHSIYRASASDSAAVCDGSSGTVGHAPPVLDGRGKAITHACSNMTTQVVLPSPSSLPLSPTFGSLPATNAKAAIAVAAGAASRGKGRVGALTSLAESGAEGLEEPIKSTDCVEEADSKVLDLSLSVGGTCRKNGNGVHADSVRMVGKSLEEMTGFEALNSRDDPRNVQHSRKGDVTHQSASYPSRGEGLIPHNEKTPSKWQIVKRSMLSSSFRRQTLLSNVSFIVGGGDGGTPSTHIIGCDDVAHTFGAAGSSVPSATCCSSSVASDFDNASTAMESPSVSPLSSSSSPSPANDGSLSRSFDSGSHQSSELPTTTEIEIQSCEECDCGRHGVTIEKGVCPGAGFGSQRSRGGVGDSQLPTIEKREKDEKKEDTKGDGSGISCPMKRKLALYRRSVSGRLESAPPPGSQAMDNNKGVGNVHGSRGTDGRSKPEGGVKSVLSASKNARRRWRLAWICLIFSRRRSRSPSPAPSPAASENCMLGWLDFSSPAMTVEKGSSGVTLTPLTASSSSNSLEVQNRDEAVDNSRGMSGREDIVQTSVGDEYGDAIDKVKADRLPQRRFTGASECGSLKRDHSPDSSPLPSCVCCRKKAMDAMMLPASSFSWSSSPLPVSPASISTPAY